MKTVEKMLSMLLVLAMLACMLPLQHAHAATPAEDQVLTTAATGTMTITMKDDDGDGWNGNKLELYIDDAFVKAYTVSKRNSTATVDYDATKHYEFKWIKGDYSDECSFSIQVDGTTVFSAAQSDCGAYTDGQWIFEYGYIPVVVASGKAGPTATWTLYDSGKLVISGTGTTYYYANSSPYVSPWQEDYCDQITKLVIEDGITTIGSNAFYLCDYLEKVTIADSVTKIESNAFRECDSLKEVTIPDSVTTLNNAAFYGCDSLKSVTLPAGITSLNTFMFYNCVSLESITIPANITKVGESVFKGCTSLCSAVIEGDITSIGGHTFSGCTGLEEVVFLGDAPTFGSGVFYGATLKAYYNGSNTTWTSSVMQNYGGTVTWCGGPVSTGTGAQTAPYVIYNEEDLRRVALFVNNGMATKGTYYRLGKNVTLTQTWIPIGTAENPFCANFDGRNYAISDMACDGYYSALFAYIGGGAAITNLTITDPKISGAQYVAGFAAYADTTTGNISMENCHLSGGTIDGNDGDDGGKYTGGFVGYVTKNESGYRLSIAECTVHAGLTGDSYMGGFVGCACGVDIRDCKNYTGVTSGRNTNAVGGIFGSANNCTVTRCANYGDVYGNAYSEENGSSYLGGIAGYANATTFISCVNYGQVSAFFVGGICGGLYLSDCEFENCLNVGDLRHSSDGSGYAIAYTGSNTYEDCYYYEGCFNFDGRGHNETTATPVTKAQLNSGEVTYLLQSTRDTQTWGQRLDSESDNDAYPVLSGDVVYRVFNCINEPIGYANEATTGVHNWADATCVAPSACTYCGQTQGQALGHTYTSVVTAPTCTEQGYTTYTCTCGHSYVDDYKEAAGHEMGEWYTVTEATCTAEGLQKRDCKNCDHSETEALSIVSHTYTSVVTTPTCTEQGYTTYTCTCGHSYVDDYKEATGHEMGEWYTVTEATCTAEGLQQRDCKNCDHSETDAIPMTSHTYTPVVTAPTCLEKGYTTYTCTCGHSYVGDYKDPVGHRYTAVVTAPTCTQQGYTTYTCACGDTYVADYQGALGHDMGQWYEEIPADCTNDGVSRSDCSRCDHTEREDIPSLGHDWDAGKVTVEPTEETTGERLHTCTACGQTKTEVIPELSHVHSYTAAVTEPTCTAQGYTTHTCSCGDSYMDTPVDPLGHNYETVVVPAGCTEQGYSTHTCTRCAHSYVDSYTAAAGHSWDAGTIVKEATEDATGEKLLCCTQCDAEKIEIIPELSHVHTYLSVTTLPTCTEQGSTTHTCTCGDTYTDGYVDALGHQYGEDGNCTGCGQEDPDPRPEPTQPQPTDPAEPDDGSQSQTGTSEERQFPWWLIILFCVLAGGIGYLLGRKKKD